MTAHQEGRGDINFSVYLAQYGTNVRLKVDASFMKNLLSGSSFSPGEREAMMNEDASHVGASIADRLALSPSRAIANNMFVGNPSQCGSLSSDDPGLILKVRKKVQVIEVHCFQMGHLQVHTLRRT